MDFSSVDVSEMMGSSIHLHMNAQGKDIVVVLATIDINGRTFNYGDQVHFSFGGNVVHLFDKKTELNLL